MEVKEKYESNLKNHYLILFGFELNRSQAVLFLILSLTGIFMLPLILAIEIFTNLFQVIFINIPSYLSLPPTYKRWPLSWVLFWYFAPVITRIIVASILLYLSIYTLKKILKPTQIKNKHKRKIIHQDRIVNWLGLKLTHGQSLFIFSVSLAGILYTVQFFFDSFDTPDFILSEFWGIGGVFNRQLLDIASIVISAIFISFFLYSMLVIKRRKSVSPSKKTVKNHGLIIFIVFLAIFLFFLMRIFYHIILFTDLAYIFGITPAATNSNQAIDFIRTVVILIISIIILIASYFMREDAYEQSKKNNELTWLRIKLAQNRAIILLSLAFLFITFFIYTFLTLIFILGTGDFIFFLSFVFIPIILLCYYSIDKILKKNRINNVLDSMESSEEIITNWFKLHLKQLDSVVFFSISSGVIVIYIFYLIGINTYLRERLLNINFWTLDFYELLSFLLVMIVLILMLAINIYTIKRTLPSLKSNQ